MEEKPKKVEHYIFHKKGIQDIKSGMNHILILTGKRVYSFGDKSRGALGNLFKNDDEIPRNDWGNLQCVSKRNIEKIFTTDYSSFFMTYQNKRTKGNSKRIYSFGLNNYQ